VTAAEAVRLEQCALGVDLCLGNAAEQMRAHVVRLGRWHVVGVAADVEVVLILGELIPVHDPGEAGNVLESVVAADDLFNVLGVEMVLSSALVVLMIGVDEEHLATPLPRLGPSRPKHEDAGGDARAVEQIRREPDDRIE
jgi:hypothetical protein